ncbi:MAG: hypothetical protein WDN45_07995 [Caulobacteraceae bacterium]
MTVDDPVTLEHPYSYKRYYEWRPDVRPAEYVCEENNRKRAGQRRHGGPIMQKTLTLLAAGAALAALRPWPTPKPATPTSPASGPSPATPAP